jgi:hypothetical protein
MFDCTGPLTASATLKQYLMCLAITLILLIMKHTIYSSKQHHWRPKLPLLPRNKQKHFFLFKSYFIQTMTWIYVEMHLYILNHRSVERFALQNCILLFHPCHFQFVLLVLCCMKQVLGLNCKVLPRDNAWHQSADSKQWTVYASIIFCCEQ